MYFILFMAAPCALRDVPESLFSAAASFSPFVIELPFGSCFFVVVVVAATTSNTEVER